MDVIEKAESEWQKIWLHILTGSFPPQGVNETVHDFAESMEILLRSMNYAWHDDCESPSEGGKLTWAREAESLITWRFWKSLRQEYRAMLPKNARAYFESLLTKDPSITESHLVTPHLGNFQNSIINPFNGYKNDDRRVRKSEENEPGFRHSRGVTHDNPCIVKVSNIKSPKVDKHILFIDEIENETRNGLNLTPNIGIGPKMTHPCANNDLVEKRKHDENVLGIRHIETNGDKLLKTPKLENKFEHSRRVIYENEAQELRVSKMFNFKLQPHGNTKSSNHEAGCKGKRRVEESGERFA
ncbi:hypothetical protein QAD02_003076 [Eretmocerus hayati]|uniref:Uncharacterized protein n=1 Tax=Eretmocerus hayati TaxID=131215 RepID=A0ACC2NNK7_9HYME|nr:hypothetical protein QAD02_003076 [Eretmocerus hayati]